MCCGIKHLNELHVYANLLVLSKGLILPKWFYVNKKFEVVFVGNCFLNYYKIIFLSIKLSPVFRRKYFFFRMKLLYYSPLCSLSTAFFSMFFEMIRKYGNLSYQVLKFLLWRNRRTKTKTGKNESCQWFENHMQYS